VDHSHAQDQPAPIKSNFPEKIDKWNDRRSNAVAIRHLSGTMDEFALWDRVLSDSEIHAMAR
jgi:hypothetical protein